MCGRYTLKANKKEWAEFLASEGLEEFSETRITPRFNVAPTDEVVAVVQPAPGEGRELRSFRWGLVPSWAKDPRIGARMINARSETVATKPAFRAAFKRRRCLVLADGFFEWERRGKERLPRYFRLRSKGIFGFAGLHERTHLPDGQPLETCTVITCEPNALVAGIHDRMPAILKRDDYHAWLGDLDAPEPLLGLLQPYPADRMESIRVSKYVNKAGNEGPECVEPIDDA